MNGSHDIAFQEVGNGVPVLILHGWTMAGFVEAHDFEPVFSTLSEYRRLYLDLPGMGASSLGDSKDLDSMLDRVSSFVEEHILPSSFLLIGTSCGAYLARALAYRYANAVEGLLLRIPLIEPVSSKRDIDPFVPAISNEAVISALSQADHERLGDVPVHTAEYVETARRRLDATVFPAIAASDAAGLDAIRNDRNRYKLKAAMHTPEEPFTKPTLIVTGRHDTDVGYRDAWSIVPCYARASFMVLDRGNHDLPVDEAETKLFVALVQDWLWRVKESRQAALQT